MSLVKHAEYELRRAGLFDKDSDYEGMLGDATMKLIRVFAEEGHSGFSAHLAIQLFTTLASFKVLTPLTDNPEEWNDVSGMGSPDSPPMWQNKRQSSCFSEDGGKTYYDVDDKERIIKQSDKAV